MAPTKQSQQQNTYLSPAIKRATVQKVAEILGERRLDKLKNSLMDRFVIAARGVLDENNLLRTTKRRLRNQIKGMSRTSVGESKNLRAKINKLKSKNTVQRAKRLVLGSELKRLKKFYKSQGKMAKVASSLRDAIADGVAGKLTRSLNFHKSRARNGLGHFRFSINTYHCPLAMIIAALGIDEPSKKIAKQMTKMQEYDHAKFKETFNLDATRTYKDLELNTVGKVVLKKTVVKYTNHDGMIRVSGEYEVKGSDPQDEVDSHHEEE